MSRRPLTPSYKILSVGASECGEHFVKVAIREFHHERIVLIAANSLDLEPEVELRELSSCLPTRAALRRFVEQAQAAVRDLPPTFRVLTRIGWNDGSFVLANNECVPPNDDVGVSVPHQFREYGGSFQCAGSLRGWRRLAELARGNSRLVLAVALSFVGPIIEILRVEAPAIQIVGRRDDVMSAIADAAGATWGGRANGFAQSWSGAEGSIERMAAAFAGTLLVLSKRPATPLSGTGEASVALSVAMRLAGSLDCKRLTKSIAPLRFAMGFLSLSSEPLDELALKYNVKISDLYREQMIDVPLPPYPNEGFENTHGYETRETLARAVCNISGEHHGHAGRLYMEKISGELLANKGALVEWLDGRHSYYLGRIEEHMASRPSGFRKLEWIHRRFATIYAAGCLAIDYGILPWSTRELFEALASCEEAHVKHVIESEKTARARRRSSKTQASRDRTRESRQPAIPTGRSLFRNPRGGLLGSKNGRKRDIDNG